jgi:hypothetical protein
MKNLSTTAKAYILGIILIGLVLTVWTLMKLDWMNPGLYMLAILGAVAQTLKVEGPNAKTNYSIAWFMYGFAFIAYGPGAAIFVIFVSHLVDWLWHKYPWFIQNFNIGAHVIPVFLAGLLFETISHGTKALDLNWFLGLVAANLLFVFGNHYLVGLVVNVARGQSFSESGVFELLTLSLDFTVLTLGTVTLLTWSYNPFLAVLNLPLLFPLYKALRIPALKRQLQEMKKSVHNNPV